MIESVIPWWDMFLRLAAAIVLSAAIGWNPQRTHKPAGLRTHILVCLGSALIMIISLELFLRYAQPGRNIDPGRIAAQVVSGIGFIGAGTIIHGEGGLVRGLTTAASVWAAAGVGLACGAGMYLLATMATVLMVAAWFTITRYLSFQEPAEPKRKKG